VQRSTKIVLTLLLAASLLSMIAPTAISIGGGTSKASDANNHTWKAPTELYMVISAKNVTTTSASFDIIGHAMRTDDGKALSKNISKPVAGQYFFANDTAVISMGDKPRNRTHDNKTGDGNRTWKKPGNNQSRTHPGENGKGPGLGDYDTTTINVAGGSAVVAWKNVTQVSKDQDKIQLQSSDLLIYVPDGTVQYHQLSTPIVMTVSFKDHVATITGNPELRSYLMGIMQSGNRFPADASPVLLKTIDTIK